MNAIQYLQNKEMRHYTLYRINPDGRECYVPKGMEIEVGEFEKSFPLPLQVRPDKLNGRSRNIDGTKNWLLDD